MTDPARCPSCGFDGAQLSPTDGAVALRSFPRRFRELADAQDDQLARARIQGAAATAARAITDSHRALHDVLIEQRPELGPSWDPNAAPADPDGSGVEALAAAAIPMAELVEATKATAWERCGQRNGAEVTALQLLREGVHAGAHYLRSALS